MSFQIDRRLMMRALLATGALAFVPAGRGSNIRPGLASTAAQTGRQFGCAVRPEHLDDPAFREAVIADCTWITPEIDLNWTGLEYHRGEFSYANADALVRFAGDHGKQLRGHMLLWDQSTPDWAKRDMAERSDWSVIEAHFERTIGRYGNAVCEWEVVNESIDTEHGTDGIRRNCFQRAFGSEYIATAFRTARQLAPATPLLINEYSLEYANPVDAARRRRLLRLLETLKRDGVPIDGVGLQAHLELAKGPLDARAIRSMVREIADMGLYVTISELDVLEADRAMGLAARDAAAADAVRAFLDIVLAESAVRGVVTWGLSDRDSWLQERIEQRGPRDLNRGLPLDTKLAPKPMYQALREVLGRSSAAI